VAPSVAALADLVADDMALVDALVLEMAGSHANMIPEVARHLIDSGGKRLRPMLTIASARAFGYQGDGHVKLAASVEFMHTATLLHDDVVDESEMRRGKLAARMLWGNQASVLVGDYLLGQAFRRMVDVGSLEALRVLSDAAAVIAEGEVLQLAASKNLATAEDQYLRVIAAKTAALFAAACEVGPIIAGEDAATCRAMAAYGRELGLAFQLVDDALDYGGSSAALGKQVGDDFREGKITLPLILAMRAGGEDDRAFWVRTVEKGDIRDGDLEHAIVLLGRHGAIAATVDRARSYGLRAREALSAMPRGEYRDALAEVVDYCISRVN
jgi:octaprenyl-diphosphate synthase